MGVPNHESYPTPIQRHKQPPDSATAYTWDPFSFTGVERETAAVINEVLKAFNEEYGTNIEPTLTGIPFQEEEQ